MNGENGAIMEIVARLVTRAKSLRQGDVTIHLHLMEDEFVWDSIIVKQHAMSFPAQVAKFLIEFLCHVSYNYLILRGY